MQFFFSIFELREGHTHILSHSQFKSTTPKINVKFLGEFPLYMNPYPETKSKAQNPAKMQFFFSIFELREGHTHILSHSQFKSTTTSLTHLTFSEFEMLRTDGRTDGHSKSIMPPSDYVGLGA